VSEQRSGAAHTLRIEASRGAWLVLRCAAVVALLALPSSAGAGTHRLDAAEDAKVVFVDVGQGDGVIIKVGGRIIVSDAGLPNAADAMHAALERLGADRHIYRAILSHAHADHVGGFIGLLEDYGYTIDAAVYAPHPHYAKTETNRELMDALTARGVPLIAVAKGDQFFWGGASWKILNPPAGAFQDDGEEANDSIAYRLRTRGSDLLFTGDIERDALPGLIQSWTYGRAEVFLVTHHGSNYGSTTELLDKIHPEFSVLSTGPNTYGHPGVYSVKRLKSSGTTIFCTEQNGTLTLTLASGGALDWRASRQEQPWWTQTDGETGKCVDR
jgi:competence protein ComEC